MPDIIGVRFKKVGKVYHFDPAGIDAKVGESVIVETARGLELGEVVVGVHETDESMVKKPLRPVIRVATKEDFKTLDDNKKKEDPKWVSTLLLGASIVLLGGAAVAGIVVERLRLIK